MRLILVRHAKTEGNNPRGDHARELTERGRNDAATVAERLKVYPIDYALVSTSARTRQTFDALDLDVPVEFLDDIYSQELDKIGQHISEVPEGTETLLIVGHSPSLPALSVNLAAAAADEAGADDVARHFPTSTFTVFSIDGDWSQIVEAEGFDAVRFEGIFRPKD